MLQKTTDADLEWQPPAISNEHEQWLKDRQQGIGGSDAAAIVGLNPYKGPFEVYCDKIYEPEDQTTERMFWGSALEDVIMDEFCRRTGYAIQRQVNMVHKQHDFLRCTLDGFGVEEETELEFIVEAKNVGYHSADQWMDDEIPEMYYIQVQHNLMVSGAQIAYVPVLIGGNEWKCWRVERDDDLIQMIIESEALFWNLHVLKKDPPKAAAPDNQFLNKKYNEVKGTEVKHDARIDKLVSQLEEVKDEEAKVKNHRAEVEAQIKQIMQEDEQIEGNFHKAKWKQTKARESFNWRKAVKENPELKKYITQGEPSRRFSVE